MITQVVFTKSVCHRYCHFAHAAVADHEVSAPSTAATDSKAVSRQHYSIYMLYSVPFYMFPKFSLLAQGILAVHTTNALSDWLLLRAKCLSFARKM